MGGWINSFDNEWGEVNTGRREYMIVYDLM